MEAEHGKKRLENGISNLFLLIGMRYNPRDVARASTHQS
jgi:hypothetical protein